MKRAILGGFAVLAIAALALAANDPWKNKPYQQWDEKDVQKVMSDSPWAKLVQVDATWQKGGDNVPSTGLPQGSSAGGGSSGGGGGRGGMGGGGGSAPSSGGGMGGSTPPSANTPQATFAVRWASSRAIREAIVRGEEISGKMKEDEGEKQVALPVDDYQVLLSGQSMAPFQSAEEAAIKSSTSLTTKKSKQKIEPSKVEFQRSADGKLYSILISFPKKTASGESTIGADEKGVEFICSVPGVNIKASFDVSKMMDSGGRDL